MNRRGFGFVNSDSIDDKEPWWIYKNIEGRVCFLTNFYLRNVINLMKGERKKLRLILASSSPRRVELLQKLGIDFEVVPSRIDEKSVKFDDPEELCKRLALMKARDVAKRREGIIVAADTIVVFKGEVLGKPKDEKEAKTMLRMLSGNEHVVMSGIAVIDTNSGKEIVDVVKTRVKFRKLKKEEIDSYVESGEPLDKAGAYAIQGKAASFVKEIHGCFYNVVGLPLARLVEMLSKL